MFKTYLSKEQYDYIRYIEEETGKKIAFSKEDSLIVPDCFDGQHGLYKIRRAYRSGENYIADMELLHATGSEAESMALARALMEEKVKAGYSVKIKEV